MGYVVPAETLDEIRRTAESYGGKKINHDYPDCRTSWADDWGWFKATTFGSGVARTLVTEMMGSGGGQCMPLEWSEMVTRFEFRESQLRAAVTKLVSGGNGRIVDPSTDPDLRFEFQHCGWTSSVLVLLSPSRLVREAWQAERAKVKASQRLAKIAARGGRVTRAAIPTLVMARVYARDDFTCQECGATEDLTLDHIKPWSLGGPDTVDNLRVLCRPCNSRKGDKA